MSSAAARTLTAMKNFNAGDNVTKVLVLAITVVGCYTAMSIVGSSGTDALADAIKVLVGGIAGLAVASKVT